MNTIKHHLTDALLIGYSAGTLPEAFNLVVATHISLCDECRSRMHSFDAVGGNVMLDAGTAEMSDGSFDAVLAMIANDNTPEAAEKPQKAAEGSVFPAPLQDYVGGDLSAVKWRRIGGGVSQAVLRTSPDATVRLLKIPGGVAVPDHGHRGVELTLVLQGAFKDETDSFHTGDIEVANEDMVHQPVAEEGMDCICLAATDAPLRFSRLLPRLAQGIMGI
ncbi:ChrR family anti-sigma-E factor [Flavimaricola marinus]|uniref:Anti-sigma-E factor ChrR n=1 Tax=Flavimaricola marinus TaxID=1819565 RepID=A0A238LHY2_9RHOB|nr:ChrR family anti-sigma-E factor [Flavimaricola marinus]SMY09005.1 Anti-sigma-E factor ChrR [Flavimaricola marinus]